MRGWTSLSREKVAAVWVAFDERTQNVSDGDSEEGQRRDRRTELSSPRV